MPVLHSSKTTTDGIDFLAEEEAKVNQQIKKQQLKKDKLLARLKEIRAKNNDNSKRSKTTRMNNANYYYWW